MTSRSDPFIHIAGAPSAMTAAGHILALALLFAAPLSLAEVDDDDPDLGMDEIVLEPNPVRRGVMVDSVLQDVQAHGARLAESFGQTQASSAGTATIVQSDARSNNANIQQSVR